MARAASPTAPDDIPRWVFVVVVLFWLSSVASEVVTTLLDPEVAALVKDWPRFVVKRAALALFWIAASIAALFWYRERPVTADNLGPSLLGALIATALVSAAFAVYFGALLSAMSLGRVSFARGFQTIWGAELLYACMTVWQVLFAANAYHYYARMVRRQREADELQLRLARTELSLFRAQLEPHFLFNTLNSIAALVRLERKEQAVDALNQLSALLRGVLEVGTRQASTWQWEQDFTRRYVALQQLRFGERLDVVLDPGDLPADAPFPALLLQPLIENAVVHGPLVDARPCEVVVRLRRAQGRIQVEVSNEVGQAAAPAGHGVGLANVAARLRAVYGDDFAFTQRRDDHRFVVEAAFPEAGRP